MRALANRELDAAMADCNAAVSKRPDSAVFLDSQGFVWFRKGDFDKAIGAYDQALIAKPDIPATLYRRGLAKIRKGDKDDGKTDIAKALALDPHAGDDMKDAGIKP